MSDLESFAKLAALAGRDTAPSVDVTARVMQAVRALPQARPAAHAGESLSLVMVAISWLAAAVLVAWAWQSLDNFVDPLDNLLEPIIVVMK